MVKAETLHGGRAATFLDAAASDLFRGFGYDRGPFFTALTGAFGEGEQGPVNQSEHQYCHELARLLLEAGADPNDSQTLYNRMFSGGTRHLKLVADPLVRDPAYNATPLGWAEYHHQKVIAEFLQRFERA